MARGSVRVAMVLVYPPGTNSADVDSKITAFKKTPVRFLSPVFVSLFGSPFIELGRRGVKRQRAQNLLLSPLTTAAPPKDDGLSAGAIAGTVVGAVAGTISVASVLFVIIRKRRTAAQRVGPLYECPPK